MIIAINGERLLGLPDSELHDVFGANLRHDAEVLLLRADELQQAIVHRDSNEECPCEDAHEPHDRVPATQMGDKDESAHEKQSSEYPAVVRIPVGRSIAWAVPPDTKDCLDRDLAHLGERFGLAAVAKLDRCGNMESVELSGLSTAIASARGEVVQILQFYREGKYNTSHDDAAPPSAARPGEEERAKDASVEGLAAAPVSVPGHVEDLRQFQYHDHTADIIVHSWGKTRAEAFAQVCVGMFQYMTNLDNIDFVSSVDVEATGHDLLDLLYHLLDEFLFIFSTELHVSRCIEILEFDEEALKIRARGYGEKMALQKHEQGTEIKAVTMHMMKILGPEGVTTETGTTNATDTEDRKEGFPHEVYVLLDI